MRETKEKESEETKEKTTEQIDSVLCEWGKGFARSMQNLAKWILLNPKVLIIDEPTRGVDIGAKSDIYAILRKLASQGMAIIVVSSEIPEVMGVCDTIYVMKEGRITAVMPSDEVTEEKIGYYSTIGDEAQ